MTEEKELLLKVLCAMLPYGVKCHFKYGSAESDIILKCIDGNIARFDYGWYGKFHVNIDPQYIKPYLRPLSSMTEKEMSELRQWGCLCMTPDNCVEDVGVYGAIHGIPVIVWFISHHFDFCGFIKKGIVLEAPDGMY